MSNVILVVKVKVKEEFEEQVYTFMKALHKLTHEFDEGCIQYDLHKVKDEKSTFCFIETWENQEALDAHMKKDHFTNFVEFTKDKTEAPEFTFLDKYVEQV